MQQKRKVILWTEEETIAVCAALKAIRNMGPTTGPLEVHLTKAQELALPPERHRNWHSSTASVFNTTFFKPLMASGRIDYPARKTATPPVEVKVAGLQRTPSINIQASNGASITLEQSVYEAVIAHYKTAHPPAPAVEKPKSTIDAIFSEMIDSRLQEILPKMFSELSAKLSSRFDSVEHRIGENFNNFMQYLDPNWADAKDKTKDKVEDKQVVPDNIEDKVASAPKERKPVIVLINANTSQRISVQKEFPDYDVRSITNRVPGEVSPLMVVGFTKFMAHQLDNNCKKKFNDAYIRMPTGTAVSDAKNRIREHLSKINPR